MKELTDKQIKRQDFVDNAIFNLIQSLNTKDKTVTNKTISKAHLSFPQSLSGNPVFHRFSWIPAFAGMTDFEALLMNFLVTGI